MSAFLKVILQFPENLDPKTRAELEQIVAALQAYALKAIPAGNGGLGIDASGVRNGQIPIGDQVLRRFVLNRITAGFGVIVTSGRGTITISITPGLFAPSDATYLTETNEIVDLPNSRRVLAGTNVTFDDTVAGARTVNVAGGGGHLHGMMRILGDGATVTFNLLDFAEYLEHVGVNGAFVDPATFTLSANRSQITFGTAPGAGQIATLEYVIASL
jgi:hypothetical protein